MSSIDVRAIVKVKATGAEGKVKYLAHRAVARTSMPGAFVKFKGENFARWYPLHALEPVG